MNNSKAHQELLDQVLLALGKRPDVRLWKNATGVARSLDSERVVSFGLKGSSDLIGILKTGKFLAVEIKTGKAVQTEQQKNFQAMIERFGGLYILARSVQDALDQLEKNLAP